MIAQIRLFGAGDEAALANVVLGVYNHPVQPRFTEEFLADSRHHLAVACEAGRVVGFASGVHYVHPEKPAEVWMNEVAVAPTHQRRGLARQLLRALFAGGRAAGCRQAWVLTDRSNGLAMRMYGSLGGVEAPDPAVMFEVPLEPLP